MLRGPLLICQQYGIFLSQLSNCLPHMTLPPLSSCLCLLQGSQGGQRSTQNNVEREKSLLECFLALFSSAICHSYTLLATHVCSSRGLSQDYIKFFNPSGLSLGRHPASCVHHLFWEPSVLIVTVPEPIRILVTFSYCQPNIKQKINSCDNDIIKKI